MHSQPGHIHSKTSLWEKTQLTYLSPLSLCTFPFIALSLIPPYTPYVYKKVRGFCAKVLNSKTIPSFCTAFIWSLLGVIPWGEMEHWGANAVLFDLLFMSAQQGYKSLIVTFSLAHCPKGPPWHQKAQQTILYYFSLPRVWNIEPIGLLT